MQAVWSTTLLALKITLATLISEAGSRTADWFRFQNQRPGCCPSWWRQELGSGVGSRIDGKKTDIKVDGNNCAGRQTTAGLTSGLMAGLDEKIGDRFCDIIGGKVVTQLGHGELNWAGLVAGRHTKRTTHANAQALNSGHVKKSLDLLIRVA